MSRPTSAPLSPGFRRERSPELHLRHDRRDGGHGAAGLGDDLLLANEVVDARRLGQLVELGARVTVAVDSEATIDAAAAGGVSDVLVDVNVGCRAAAAIPPMRAGSPTRRARGSRSSG